MADTIFSEAFNDQDALEFLDKIEKQIGQIGKEADAMGKEMSDAFKQADADAASLSDTLGAAADQEAKIRSKQAQDIERVTRANQSWYQSIKQTIGGQQVAGKSISEWGQQAQAFASRVNLGGKAIEGMSAAGRVLTGVLKATGIGILIGLVGSAIAYFTRFQSGIDKVSQVTAALSATINVIIDRFLLLASAIGKVFSGDFAGAANDVTQAVTGIGDAIVNAATAAYDLEKRIQTLRDVTITQSVEAARARVELEKYKQVMDDGTLSVSARVKATQQAAEIEKRLAGQALDRALEAQQIAQGKFALDKESLAAKEEAAAAEIALQEAVIENNAVTAESEQKLRELRKEANDKRLKQLDEEHKALEKIAKDLAALRVEVTPEGLDKELAATNKRFDDLQKTTKAGIDKLNEIDTRRGLSDEEQAQLDELNQIKIQLEERRMDALLDALIEQNERETKLQEEQLAKQRALKEKDFKAALDSTKAISELKKQEIDLTEEQFKGFIALLESQGADEKLVKEKQFEFDQIIKEKRIRNEIELQEALLALTDAGDTTRIQAIRNNIALLKAQLDTALVPDKKDGKDKGFDIWSLLGVDDKEGKQRWEDSVKAIVDGLDQILEARIREKEAATQAAEERVKLAEQALEEEQKIAKDGHANNVDALKLELAESKKARDQALKEEQKAKRAQLLLDSATQLSSLITAAANILKGFSTIPILGQVLAVAAVASMFGAFALAKSQAAKAIQVPKLRKGAKIVGRSHESGGELRELEHGEQVVGAAESMGQDVFFDRMRKGYYRGVDIAALAERKTDDARPLAEASPRIHRIEERRANANEAAHFKQLAKTYEVVGDKITAAIKERPDIYPWKDGYKAKITRGSVTETKTVLPE